jgi:hypothetical protein
MELDELKKLALKHNTEIVSEYSDDCDFCMYVSKFVSSQHLVVSYDKDETEKMLEEKGEDYDWDPKYRVVLHRMDDMAYEFCEAVLYKKVKKIWIQYADDWMDELEDYIREELD